MKIITEKYNICLTRNLCNIKVGRLYEFCWELPVLVVGVEPLGAAASNRPTVLVPDDRSA
jgi:hypothetical protein